MDNFIGEIRIFAGSIVPTGWHACDGTLLSVDEHDALFSLIGTTYGGDGRTDFALPNLVARIPIGHGRPTGGNNYALGAAGGAAEVTITPETLAAHSHSFHVTTRKATKSSLDENSSVTVLAAPDTPNDFLYIKPNVANTTKVTLAGGSVGLQGGGMPHSNLMPTFSLRYIIALHGNYPSFPAN